MHDDVPVIGAQNWKWAGSCDKKDPKFNITCPSATLQR